MQRHIQQITQQFVDRLPENDQYYRPDELRSWGFPSFLVKRIKIELERNLEESLIVPKTDWANTQSDAVQDSWQKFVDAIQAEVRLPASYGKTVIETAVADIMEMLVQPRKNIPEVIFGQNDQLSHDQVREGVKAVVVYPHFARLIPRYMQKKELETLTKSRCRKIVSTADEKLTSRYSPLNWAQMLEPIFKLIDGEIDTDLLRLFFEDKDMRRVARKFDLMNDSLTRAELIEALSSPELLNLEGYEDDQSSLFEDQPTASPSPYGRKTSEIKKKSSKQASPEEEEEEQQDFLGKAVEESESPADVVDQNQKSESVEKESENTLNTGFFQNDEQAVEAEDDEEDSINSLFKDEEGEEVEKSETVPEKAESSQEDEILADREVPYPLEKQSTINVPEKSDAAVDEAERSGFKEEAPQENQVEKTADDDEEEETPIWMRFMSDEEIEEYQRQQEQEEQSDEVEEGFIDEPIVDLTNEDASDEEINNLRDRLSADRNFFVEEIFRGSERAFDEAVENIAPYDNWRQASKYIEKEIFKRNLVDVYSEAAVSFTDQLQGYFLEKNQGE